MRQEQDFYLVVNVYLSCFVEDSHFFPTRQFPLVLVLRGLTQPRFLNVELSSVSPPSSDVLTDANSHSSHISIHASDAEGLGKALRVVSFRTFSPQSIDPGQQFTWEHSNLEVNKPKNRYANVIAYDHSRVILAPIEGRAELHKHTHTQRNPSQYVARKGSRMTELCCRPHRSVWLNKKSCLEKFILLQDPKIFQKNLI